MSEEDNLFGDLGIAEVTRRRPVDTRTAAIKEGWALWSEVSDRPKAPVPDRFAKAYGEMLDLKYSQEVLLNCVRAAVYLPPRQRDPQDIQRVITTLTNSNTEREAIALMSSGEVEPQLWKYDDLVTLSTPKQLSEACGIDIDTWTHGEHEAAGLLIGKLNPEELVRAATATKVVTGQNQVFPSEVIRHSSSWKDAEAKIKPKEGSSRDTYASGRAESEMLEGLELNLDRASQRLLLEGAPAAIVRRFHLDVPEGFWDAVADALESDLSLKTDQAVSQVAEASGWNPAARLVPTW